MTIELRGPTRKRLLPDVREQIATTKWSIDDDRDATFLRARENFFLRLAFI